MPKKKTKSLIAKNSVLSIDPLKKKYQDRRNMIIAGHELTPRDMELFTTYYETKSTKKTAEICGVGVNYIYNIKRTPWWRELERDIISGTIDDFMHKFVGMGDQIIESVKKVLEGGEEHWQSGSSNAIMKALENYLEMSPKGNRPIKVKRIDAEFILPEKVSESANLTPEAVKELSQEDVAEFARTGNIPAKLLEVKDITITDIEFEEEKDDDILNTDI